MTGENILCISSIDWDFIWQGHQEIMSAFAEAGNRVLFIENTGVRSPRFRDWPRLKKRIRNWFRGTKGFRQERGRLFVYSPIILPFPYSRMARWVNRWLLIRAIQRWMRAMGVSRPIVWTFLPTPLARDLIRAVDPILTVYYCIDDFASSSPQARRIARSEITCFQEADLVFVTSEQLRQRAARYSRRVSLFPFGVDFEKFERARLGGDDVPDDLRDLPRPVVGYIGGLHQWVDQELMVAVAKRLPTASFVLVGPAQTDLSHLAQAPNIHVLGARPHAEIPRLAKSFDVAMVPYRLSAYTDHVYPTKLNEYLAMGLPVVATDLPEIHRFNTTHGHLVTVARDPQHFASAIEAATRQRSPEAVRKRIEASRQNSWQIRIAQMSSLIEEALAARRPIERAWQDTLHRLYRAARRQIGWTVLPALLAYLLVFHSPLIWWVAAPLRVASPPQPADAIVVFAGGVGETGKAGGGGGYQERVKQAIDLYTQGMAAHLVFSSGYTFVFREAEVMRDLAVDHGVPASAITLETHAANTVQNVTHVNEILAREGWESILLISSPYHMRRAIWTFRKLAPAITVIPSPVPHSRFYSPGRGARLDQFRAILHEYLGILYYWWKGWL